MTNGEQQLFQGHQTCQTQLSNTFLRSHDSHAHSRAFTFDYRTPQPLVLKLPCSVQDARKLIGSNHSSLQKFACCPSCHSIYKQEDCILEDSSGEKVSRKCNFRKFPNDPQHHPQPQHRCTCDTLMMKKVKLPSGRVVLRPHLIYCYKSIIESLQEMLKREGFQEKCELWRKRNSEGLFEDVYDGQVWKDFLHYDTLLFLALAYNFAFQLNADWFQPFEHTQH